MEFSIGYKSFNPKSFDKYLGPSITGLQGEFNILSGSDKPPAEVYNELIERCETQHFMVFLGFCCIKLDVIISKIGTIRPFKTIIDQ